MARRPHAPYRRGPARGHRFCDRQRPRGPEDRIRDRDRSRHQPGPALRARLRERARRRGPSARRRWPRCAPHTASCRRRSRAAARMKYTPKLTFHYDEGPERAMRLGRAAGRRMSGLGDRGHRPRPRGRGAARRRTLPARPPTRAPTATRSARCWRCTSALTQLGKDSVMFLDAKEFPLPVEYRFLPLEEVFHEPPADVVDRTLVFLDCGNIDRMPVEFLQRDGAPHPEHRPPPRQHPLRHRQRRRHRGLLHGRDRARGDQAPRRRGDARRSRWRSTSA